MAREVSQTRSQQFREDCKEYTLGFSLALFAASSLFAHLIVWRQYLPASVHETAAPFFVVLSLAGFAVLGIAHANPVGFHELMEGR